jgi:hypothetical protein
MQRQPLSKFGVAEGFSQQRQSVEDVAVHKFHYPESSPAVSPYCLLSYTATSDDKLLCSHVLSGEV